MKWIRCWFGSAALASTLCSCGTYVPEMQNPWEARDVAVIQVDMLRSHVTCEVVHAVQMLLKENAEANAALLASHQKPFDISDLRNWVAEIVLTLTVEEKSQLNPNVSLNAVYPNVVDVFKTGAVTIGQSGALGLAGNFSADATRKVTIAFGFNLRDYLTGSTAVRLTKASEREEAYGQKEICSPTGGAFTDGDLKFRDTLESAFAPAELSNGEGKNFLDELKIAEKANKKDVIAHEVTFVVIYGAGITPSIKLVNVGANQTSAPFLGAQRTNTQDVLITLGPKIGDAPNPTVAATILASQINIGTINAIGQLRN